LTPLLVKSGYRVVAIDDRGHGDSSTTFTDVSAAAVGSDVVALIDKLAAGRAIIIGNSMAGASAVWAAAERPDLVRGLVLVAPFVRDIPAGFLQTAMLKLAMLRPWGHSAWGSYYKSLYVTNKPSDLDDYTQALVASLKQSGRLEALRGMLWASKAPCEKRIPEVKAPALVIMGSRDPDFQDPTAEARHVAEALHGEFVMADGAGHYPHSEQPQLVADAVVRLGEKAE
jgi:pimeloyl-ACP methyl ester carboxylesterase